MKQLLLCISLFATTTTFCQITVDESMSPQELIESIFLNGSVVDITNIESQSGSDFGFSNSIGSFTSSDSNFPFSGVILSTGALSQAPGPNLNIQGEGGWGGDSDIEVYTEGTNTTDASFLQFNFIPYANQLNLSFILLSEEYDQNFECSFADTFAFVLTDLETGVVENIALIPETDTPISVTNIHPEIVGNCPAVNEDFFGQYNFEPFNSSNDSPTNFNGQTAEIMVSTQLIVGHEYTIKLVIADNFDTLFDSAIFLASESFGYQLDLGPDRMASNGNAPCGNSIETLGIPEDENATYQWLELNATTSLYEPISGETNSLLDISAPGDYRLEITAANNNVLVDDIKVEFEGDFDLGNPNDLFIDEGDNDGFAIFDLTANIPIIINNEDPSNFVINFYETQLDAESEINAIVTPTAYQNIENPQTVYVRTTSLSTDCRAISNFILETDILSLETQNRDVFSMYPNPAKNIVHIQPSFEQEFFSIKIIDVQGKLVKELKSVNTVQPIDVSQFAKGLYFVQAAQGNKVSTNKLIKL